MNVFWVFAHPESRSLNGALRDFGVRTLRAAGHDVQVSDLYAMRWKAVADAADFPAGDARERLIYAQASYEAFATQSQAADVAAEQRKMEWADTVIIQFPLWWFSAPAILKGWFDRILAAGWAYRVSDPNKPGRNVRYGDGTLIGRRGMLIVTTGASAASLGPRGISGDIDDLLFPINYGVFWYTGMAALEPLVINGANRMSPEDYGRHERRLGERLATLATAPPIPYRRQEGGDWDSDFVLKPGLESNTRGHALRRKAQD